jgi:hypothetical protein
MTDMTTDRVEQARAKRQALRATMLALEAASAAPIGKDGWLDRVAEALDDLAGDFEKHVKTVEGERGLLEEIMDTAPQLKAGMQQMRNDHKELHALIDGTRTSVKDAEITPDGLAMVRREIRGLVTGLAEHRQRGADLVYDAYNVDIGAGD